MPPEGPGSSAMAENHFDFSAIMWQRSKPSSPRKLWKPWICGIAVWITAWQGYSGGQGRYAGHMLSWLKVESWRRRRSTMMHAWGTELWDHSTNLMWSEEWAPCFHGLEFVCESLKREIHTLDPNQRLTMHTTSCHLRVCIRPGAFSVWPTSRLVMRGVCSSRDYKGSWLRRLILARLGFLHFKWAPHCRHIRTNRNAALRRAPLSWVVVEDLSLSCENRDVYQRMGLHDYGYLN